MQNDVKNASMKQNASMRSREDARTGETDGTKRKKREDAKQNASKHNLNGSDVKKMSREDVKKRLLKNIPTPDTKRIQESLMMHIKSRLRINEDKARMVIHGCATPHGISVGPQERIVRGHVHPSPASIMDGNRWGTV